MPRFGKTRLGRARRPKDSELRGRPPRPQLADEERDFADYLKNCTDAQIRGVYEKETTAGRWRFVRLVNEEADRRGINLSGV